MREKFGISIHLLHLDLSTPFSFFFTVVEKDYNRAQRRSPGCNSLWALASTLLGTAVLEPEMSTIEANLAKSVSESKILC